MTTSRTSPALSSGLLLLALGAPLLLAVPAHAVGPLPVPQPVADAATAVPAVAAPVTQAVPPPVAEAVRPVVEAVVEQAPAPVRPVVQPVAEAVTGAVPTTETSPEPAPAPRPSASSRPSAPPVVGAPGGSAPSVPGTSGTSGGGATVRPAAGTSPSPVARPAAADDVVGGEDAADGSPQAAAPLAGGGGVAVVEPARITGGLAVGSDVGRGLAEAPLTAGMPAFGDVPDGTTSAVAAPLAAPPAVLLPSRPSRPTDLPAALVVVAAITLAAVGTGQLTEVVSRRRGAR